MEYLSQLEQKAIDYALKQNWEKAINYNKKILRLDKKNLDAYLRLGFALMQTGDYKKAKKIYDKALKIQPHHPTAIENLNRIKVIISKSQINNFKKEVNLDPNLFLEIPGKTKTVSLVNLGQKNILAQLSVGEKVNFKIRRRRVEVRTTQGNYIGHLPDDLSRRLQILIKAGSQFAIFIKEASFSKVIVFIKEEKRGNKVYKFFPFPLTKKIYTTENQFNETNENEDQINEETQELTEADLEKLAESLIEEGEKIEEYLPFASSNYEEEED